MPDEHFDFDEKYSKDTSKTPQSVEPAIEEKTTDFFKIDPENYDVTKPRRISIRGKITHD